MRRNFQDLTIKDAFMFAAVMSDENQCRKLLEIVLETKILHVTVITEKTMSYHPDYHGVRRDVVAEEEGGHRRFNVEMQVKRTPDLAWRSRYYHSQLDMDALLSGEVSKALTDFLRYVGQPESHCDPSVKDGFVAGLERRIQRIKVSRDREARFMRLEIELINKWRQGHLEGREEGLREGRKEGRQEGRREGRQQVLQETILELLNARGDIPEDVRSEIEAQTDEAVLKRWHMSAAKAKSMEDFRESM